MGFDIRKKWSGEVDSIATALGSKGKIVWTVVGTGGTVATKANVKSAGGTPPNNIPVRNDTQDSVLSDGRTDLFCDDVQTAQLSIGLIEVTATFSAMPGSVATWDSEIIGWQQSTVTEDVDHDIDGNPTQNLNGQVLQGAKSTFFIDVLSVTKNQTTFDWSTGLAFRNTVNDDDFTITTGTSTTTVPKGYARIASVLPTREYTLLDPYVPVRMTMEIYDGNALSNPWQMRLIHTGSEAYVQDMGDTSPQKGRVVFYDSGLAVTHDIRLDINGKPMETGDEYGDGAYAVKRVHGKAVSNNFVNSPLASGIISDLTIAPDTTTSTHCVYLIYRRCYEADFSTLFSALGIS